MPTFTGGHVPTARLEVFMGYRTLRQAVVDLERSGQLVRIVEEIDPHLEAAEVHRRVYAAGGPAIFFERVAGCSFPMVSNLFGTIDRARWMFRDGLEVVRRLIAAKVDPTAALRTPFRSLGLVRSALHMLPQRVSRGAVTQHETTLAELPRLQCWPDDGGPFVTLPLVYTEDPVAPGVMRSNLGMYRVQLAGNDYAADEVGLHYQIHRSIGVHHAAALGLGEPLRVNVFVGGSPAMMLAAVMPLPEGLSELTFAGALGRRRIRMIRGKDAPAIYAEADFCISGTVLPETKREGPFGDHLGYYSLAHEFPVLKVDHVWHRRDAIWPFTVVGRPPQEDTAFGELIHDLTGPAIPAEIPGVHAVHAVDAAGVHPLLLAIGSERYVPYARERCPQELLTQANAILGQGQLSLAKYLLLVAREDDPQLDIHDIAAFLGHLLERVDWTHDLHFQTRTTIDTLDYSGHGFNQGSKLVVAAAGPTRRELPTELPSDLHLPDGFDDPHVVLPGVLALSAPPVRGTDSESLREEPGRRANGARIANPCHGLCETLGVTHPLNTFPLIVLVDDAAFTARTLDNFLWVTFTRSNPATDVHGIGAFTEDKHWGCRGSLVIDARIKPHHAPPLVEDPAVSRRIDRLFAQGGSLHGIE